MQDIVGAIILGGLITGVYWIVVTRRKDYRDDEERQYHRRRALQQEYNALSPAEQAAWEAADPVRAKFMRTGELQ